ncbi:DUF47 domain-containing protein [Clostridium folliculivorans]|uniref:DUF47 domain-containing protein n=1 Tax=Clostridium folliculivorans TaxID=2886038 RepID=A0A9W6DAW6_9CLOT|nr:DUF47 family protein [Clostridium folliculivorans]GKU25800.1 hypothetical protein CFOLD11_26260 [Clostridium folliculivorans]GKU28821.1 hypothetical protein CFB3_09270 [Clostridium folliculivorans]
MFNLSPKNDKFFDLFISFSEIISDAARALDDFVKSPNEGNEKYEHLRDIEHRGDDELHKILEEVNNSFITPIDREDIFIIGKALDDVVDYIEDTAARFLMYNVNEVNESALLISANIVKASDEIKLLMRAFKNMKNTAEIKNKIVEVNKLENDCDRIYRESMKELFSGGTKEIKIIIWKDIYESLEDAIDSCEKLANVIEGVVTKHV